jgi:RNA polymerase sigma-70 factor (ECF subfamily)
MSNDLPSLNSPDSGGPTEQFTVLFQHHSRAIYGHIRALVPHASDVEEVFQETCVTLWQKFDQYQPGTDFRAWACRIAYYKVLKLRHQQIRSPRLFSTEFLDLLSEEMIVMSDALDVRTEALMLCREKLNERDRSLLDRFHQEGVTANDVARHVGRNVQYVYRAIRRINDVLFHCVEQAISRDRKR